VTAAEFEVDITEDDARRFAELSGDWNPLHTDSAYAAETSYRKPILHGAFSAGLLSRMAGMFIPGRDCLLHGLKLKFIAPILPPARLRVQAALVRDVGGEGLVEVNISDVGTGARYVHGSYEFGRHRRTELKEAPLLGQLHSTDAPVLVTGASGGVGAAVLARLGHRGLGVSRSGVSDALTVQDLARLPELLGKRKISGIVHCGWPTPDNQRLTDLGNGSDAAIRHHVAEPLGDCIKLAQLLADHGLPGSVLVLVGSTAAEPGRHNWGMPLYSLAKSLIPTLVKVLALELARRKQRCIGVVLDVVDGGMNARLREAVKLAHKDRSPSGELPSSEDVAAQIAWALDNKSSLVSGALLNLSGGALP
jgi:acyl dehydratase/NAD(P)-dependent dehydrogenase (short-subunit alcohol dehydrogenase family)